jgi:hypothetical protein
VSAPNPKQDRRHEEQRRWLEALIRSAQLREWYGTITVELKRGEVVQASSTETLKPPTGG